MFSANILANILSQNIHDLPQSDLFCHVLIILKNIKMGWHACGVRGQFSGVQFYSSFHHVDSGHWIQVVRY